MMNQCVVIPALRRAQGRPTFGRTGIQTVHLIGAVGVRFGLTASGLGPRLRGDDSYREQR